VLYLIHKVFICFVPSNLCAPKLANQSAFLVTAENKGHHQ
jgi:hypothetical protein